MNKANVRSNLTLFENDIAATKEQGLGYVLGSVHHDIMADVCTEDIAYTGKQGASHAMVRLASATLQVLRCGSSTTRFRRLHSGFQSSTSTRESVTSTTLSVSRFIYLQTITDLCSDRSSQ